MTDYSLIKNLKLRKNEELELYLKNLKCVIYWNKIINKWLIGLFIEGVSEIYYLTIWDLFMLEGNIVLFKAVYGWIKVHQKIL